MDSLETKPVDYNLRSKNPLGTKDILPPEISGYEYVLNKLEAVAKMHGFSQVMTPTFQYLDTYLIVDRAINRKLFVFDDKSGRKLVLKPEMNAPICRAVATKLSNTPKPLKLYYKTPVYRYENPQRGVQREFWQFGFELFGSDSVLADFEIVLLMIDCLKSIGFQEYSIRINNLGLIYELLAKIGIAPNMIGDIAYKIRFAQNEPYIQDLLRENAISAEKINAFLQFRQISGPLESQHDKVREIMERCGCAPKFFEALLALVKLCVDSGIPSSRISLHTKMMRGTMHYTGNVFEVYIPGFDGDVCGGGRYDDMVKLYGKVEMQAVGCAFGVDRLVMLAEEKKLIPEKGSSTKIFIIPIGNNAFIHAFGIAAALRDAEISTEIELVERKLARSIEYANKVRITYILICGEKEIEQGKFPLKNLDDGHQQEVSLKDLIQIFGT